MPSASDWLFPFDRQIDIPIWKTPGGRTGDLGGWLGVRASGTKAAQHPCRHDAQSPSKVFQEGYLSVLIYCEDLSLSSRKQPWLKR